MTKEKIYKKIKLNWLTCCPICGKTHINIWIYIENPKKNIYKGICPQTKEYFEIKCH